MVCITSCKDALPTKSCFCSEQDLLWCTGLGYGLLRQADMSLFVCVPSQYYSEKAKCDLVQVCYTDWVSRPSTARFLPGFLSYQADLLHQASNIAFCTRQDRNPSSIGAPEDRVWTLPVNPSYRTGTGFPVHLNSSGQCWFVCSSY